MNYSVLTNRKRAVIALVHSVFFFFVALAGLVGQSAIPPLAMAMSPAIASCSSAGDHGGLRIGDGHPGVAGSLLGCPAGKALLRILCDQRRNRVAARALRRHLAARRSVHPGNHARLRDRDLHADLAFASGGSVTALRAHPATVFQDVCHLSSIIGPLQSSIVYCRPCATNADLRRVRGWRSGLSAIAEDGIAPRNGARHGYREKDRSDSEALPRRPGQRV